MRLILFHDNDQLGCHESLWNACREDTHMCDFTVPGPCQTQRQDVEVTRAWGRMLFSMHVLGVLWGLSIPSDSRGHFSGSCLHL